MNSPSNCKQQRVTFPPNPQNHQFQRTLKQMFSPEGLSEYLPIVCLIPPQATNMTHFPNSSKKKHLDPWYKSMGKSYSQERDNTGDSKL